MSVLGEHTEQALNEFGEDVVKFAKINIGAKRRYKRSSGRTSVGRIDTTGTLRNSLGFTLKQSKNSFSLKVGAKGKASKYADVVESGRRKGKGVPISELIKWIKKKRIKIRDADGKFVKQTKGAAFGMAKKISDNAKKNGIPAKHYLRDASDQAFKKHRDNLEGALFRDAEQAALHIVRQLETIGKASR